MGHLDCMKNLFVCFFRFLGSLQIYVFLFSLSSVYWVMKHRYHAGQIRYGNSPIAAFILINRIT